MKKKKKRDPTAADRERERPPHPPTPKQTHTKKHPPTTNKKQTHASKRQSERERKSNIRKQHRTSPWSTTTFPLLMTNTGTPWHTMPSNMLKSTAWWCVSAEMVRVWLGSHTTTSASEPSAMRPCHAEIVLWLWQNADSQHHLHH